MSSETRLVRPYVGGSEFQTMLDQVTLRCADHVLQGGEEATVSLDDYLNAPTTLRLESMDRPLVTSGASSLRLDPKDIDFLVYVVAPRLRFVDEVFRSDLSAIDDVPEQIVLSTSDRPRALRAPHGGADIRVFFCLNRTLNPRPAAPWRIGTWLGQQQFRIRSGLSGAGFVPIRMTDEDRTQFGLPKDTVRFATLDDSDPFDLDPPADAVKIYVDGELLDRLAVAAGSPVGKHIQRQLFLDAVAAIIFSAHRRFRDEPGLLSQSIDDFKGSLVYKLTELIAGKGSGSADARQAAFARMKDVPTVFLAEVEAKTGIRTDILDSFGDVG